MATFERNYNNNYLRRGKIATAVAAIALTAAGCGPLFGDGSSKSEGIPSCPDGYESGQIVHNQNTVIRAFEAAGQDLAADFRSVSGRNDPRVRNAFLQLFKDESGVIFSDRSAASARVSPESYLADDPSELMCHLDNSEGESVTVLSPRAIQAKTILSKSDNPVILPRNTVR
jgi:hypothetical protein